MTLMKKNNMLFLNILLKRKFNKGFVIGFYEFLHFLNSQTYSHKKIISLTLFLYVWHCFLVISMCFNINIFSAPGKYFLFILSCIQNIHISEKHIFTIFFQENKKLISVFHTQGLFINNIVYYLPWVDMISLKILISCEHGLLLLAI